MRVHRYWLVSGVAGGFAAAVAILVGAPGWVVFLAAFVAALVAAQVAVRLEGRPRG